MLLKFIIGFCILSLTVSVQGKSTSNQRVIEKTSEGSLYDTDQTEQLEQSNEGEGFAPSSSSQPTINEDWYTLWGLGLSESDYSGVYGDVYENSANASGADRTLTVNIDIFGFYWPLAGHKTMLGVIMSGAGDTITYSDGSKTSFTTSMLSFSTHHFFGKNIGDGLFLRGDIGLTRASVDNTVGFDETTDPEVGTMLGGGYGFAIGRETRLLVGLYFRTIPKLEFNSGNDVKGTVTNLTAGFLF